MKRALFSSLSGGILSAILLINSHFSMAQDCKVNILIAYSSEAADSMGGDQTITNAIIDAVQFMNTAYIYSDVRQQSLLVRTVVMVDEETSCFASDLNTFQASTYIAALRNKYHADVAVIVLANNEFCGLPYYDNQVADDSSAYCAVNFYCMMNNFALSHQVAHLYGCGHAGSTRTENSDAVYSYGHGFNWSFNDCASFSTIMGVGDDDFCFGDGEEDAACNIIPYFSNPSLLYNGVQLGIPNVNDNARVLNQNTSVIGALKTVPATQTGLTDTVNLFNIALATAIDTLSTGTTYVITDSANVTFQASQKIIINPGFSATEGTYFQTVLRKPDEACGQ